MFATIREFVSLSGIAPDGSCMVIDGTTHPDKRRCILLLPFHTRPMTPVGVVDSTCIVCARPHNQNHAREARNQNHAREARVPPSLRTFHPFIAPAH